MPAPAPAKNRISPRWLCFVALLATCLAGASAIAAVDSGLHVEAAAGAVKIRMSTGTADRWETPVIGSAVTLPAIISTGADGSARLRHDQTVISVAAETAIELLDGEGSGILQRAVQERGSAFYDIAPQGENKFRVETPYLVAVIKGTQFNVTVSDDVASVSLFEGKLRIEAPDVADAVDLNAGQIAQRRKGEQRITVLSMSDGEPVSRNEGKASPESARPPGDNKGVLATTDTARSQVAGVAATGEVAIGTSGTGASVEGDLRLDKDGVSASADTKLNVGELASAELEAESNLDLADAEATLSVDEELNLGESSIDTGADSGVDLDAGEVDLGLDNTLATGSQSIDTGIETGVDLGDGTADLGVDSSLDLLDADLGVDADAGIDLNLDLGADGELLDVDLGLVELTDPQNETVVEEEDADTLLPDPGDLLGL